MLTEDESCELVRLRQEVAELRSQVQAQGAPPILSSHSLSKAQAERYARQISLKSFGPAAQERLCRGSALLVGAGGLGCPCAMYLAAAGIGTLGLVDRAHVSLDNLHRQVAHREATVGMHKADSARAACRAINSGVAVATHRDGLTPANAVGIVSQYDVVIDCSDNAPTRYLVSDACVMAGRPLVSGAAVGTDGQLTVYNHEGGPCYRCLFPECPVAQHCSRCEDAGVLGPVPGVIGTLQALEAIKVITRVPKPLSQTLLVYDALAARFSSVKLRGKRADCAGCGDDSPLRQCGGPAGYDYAVFTGGQGMVEAAASLNVLPRDRRLTAPELQALLSEQNGGANGVLLLDVRPAEQYAVARIAGAVNVPMEQVAKRLEEVKGMAGAASQVAVLCRRGNDSQLVAQQLLDAGMCNVRDLQGGLDAWSDLVDPRMPRL